MGQATSLHSKEGVTQGYSLAMISYYIWVLPLIIDLQNSHPHVTQPWYADEAGEGGEFGKILTYFRDLQVRGPPRGDLQEPTNIILVVAPRNVARAKEFFWGMGKTVVTRSHYLGGFICDREKYTTWLDDKVQGWADSVRTLSGVAHKHPQSNYTILQKSLQQEWAFV